MDRIFRNIIVVVLSLFLAISAGGVKWAHADESDIFLANLKPNVLIILDNSNSMDEDFVGNAICSWVTGSRGVEGRRQLLNVVNANANNMRIGLMSFKLPASSKQYLHNSPYYVSYNKKSYCPTPPAEPGCVDYCINGTLSSKNACNTACQAGNANFDADYTMSDANGQDKVLTNVVGNAIRTKYCPLIYPKTNRIVNPTDGSHYVYYKLPGTDYAGSNQGNGFCYATTYVANGTTDTASDDSYACYHTKTGTNDDLNNYSTNFYNGTFVPTDEDVALGFLDFGKRNFWYYTGRTWFANSSPGNGSLQVACNDNNPGNNIQLNALTAKLAMHENDETGYMSCANTGNPNACTYIVDAGLTPTAGTFRSARNYFRGDTDYLDSTAYTSPVQAWCQKNFIIFVTDGLPSTNESGTGDTATNLIPTSGVTSTQGTVLYEINQLRSLTVPSITGYTFDINTYVLGMALTDQSKASLDLMAQVGGTADVNGHAYYADNPTQLQAALAAIPIDIISRTYSFSVASVSSSRITDENYLYEASFVPLNGDPFWRGYLKQYNINADGTLGSVNWEAGSLLAGVDATTRAAHMFTSSGGSLMLFRKSGTPHVTHTMVNTDTTTRDNIVDYIQGQTSYNPEPGNWKLGDIFHSQPVNIGTPNAFYEDLRDQNYNPSYSCNGTTISANAFDQYRCEHPRSTANSNRRIVAGANDGQLHVFSTSDGSEQWSFIPPNLLPQLQYITHPSI
ncbi:MAG TPA: hypothetical protein VLZ07_01000, partial [Syntrophales bacterium]|nr:hypothetical protein [Syntrophales bacterium]